MCVFGGAGGLHDLLVPQLRRLMKRGVVAAAVHAGGLIIDGGTAAGIMDMVGGSLAGAPPRTLRLIGVCPAPLIALPNAAADAPPPDASLAPLESHHSNFVLVPAADWGGETSTIFTFASALSARLPCVAVLANGGMISRKEVLFAVRHGFPVVVIEGSGRLADQVRPAAPAPAHAVASPSLLLRLQLARAVHKRELTPPEEYDPAALHADPEIREIMTAGDLRLINVTAHGDRLRDALLDILAAQRDRLLLGAGGGGGGGGGSSARAGGGAKSGRGSGMSSSRAAGAGSSQRR